MSRPNIFNYATKELSQDAMICWFLECLNSEDEEYRQLGLNFVRFIFNDNEIKEAKLFNNSFPKTQYEKIDVYAEIVINGTVYPVIFEDKTNTYLHDEQMYKYCKKIKKAINTKAYKKQVNDINYNSGKIIYIYFKSGYASKWEKYDIANKQNKVKEGESKSNKEAIDNVVFKEIYLENIVEFLNKQTSSDILFTDYRDHLRKLHEKRNKILNNYMTTPTECSHALDEDNQTVSFLLLEKIFGKCWIEYTANNKLAIVYPFYTLDKNQNKIFYNLGLTGRNGKYYFRFEQWQKEDKLQTKRDEAKKIQKFCKKITEDYSSFEFPPLRETLNNSYKIFKFHINKNYSIEETCKIIKKVVDEIATNFETKPLDITKEKDWENK